MHLIIGFCVVIEFCVLFIFDLILSLHSSLNLLFLHLLSILWLLLSLSLSSLNPGTSPISGSYKVPIPSPANGTGI